MNRNPSPSTRFQKGNKASPGRPKGSPNKATVKRKVDHCLSKMLGQAHKNVADSLKKGHVTTSIWLIEHLRRGKEESFEEGVLAPLVQALETIEDVEQISKQAVLLAIKGDMTFNQVRAVQEMLARHTVLKGAIEIASLRREMEELRSLSSESGGFGVDHYPSWMNSPLIEGKANKDS